MKYPNVQRNRATIKFTEKLLDRYAKGLATYLVSHVFKSPNWITEIGMSLRD